jgi:hypothetical protein
MAAKAQGPLRVSWEGAPEEKAMSQNTCRKAKVIRPEEGGSDPADKDPGVEGEKAPVESFWA